LDVEKPSGEDSSRGAVAEQPRPDWTPQSRRTGAIAIKVGMTQLWNDVGEPVPVTVLQVLENEVVNVRTKEKEGYWGVQVGGVNHPKPKNLLKAVVGQYNRAGIAPKRKLWEFRVTEDALLAVGTPILAAHFMCGQYVDVCATSIGKGFQGVMKRHGMKGQPASHGQTKTHRKMGATGGAQDPGRIWPGKRMPGRMGGKRVTTPSLKVSGIVVCVCANLWKLLK
jgi:large subunit ribosomal protein L3